jgi:hypothetical protein
VNTCGSIDDRDVVGVVAIGEIAAREQWDTQRSEEAGPDGVDMRSDDHASAGAVHGSARVQAPAAEHSNPR